MARWWSKINHRLNFIFMALRVWLGSSNDHIISICSLLIVIEEGMGYSNHGVKNHSNIHECQPNVFHQISLSIPLLPCKMRSPEQRINAIHDRMMPFEFVNRQMNISLLRFEFQHATNKWNAMTAADTTEVTMVICTNVQVPYFIRDFSMEKETTPKNFSHRHHIRNNIHGNDNNILSLLCMQYIMSI